MRSLSLGVLTPSGFRRLAYHRWPGPSRRPPLLCLHGLTRNGRDFDRLAASLAVGRTVVAPDMPGRGASDWLADAAHYAYPVYIGVMAQLIAWLGAPAIDIVGTSMGGLIGMMLAAESGTPVRRLVMNDVGPFLPASGLAPIAEYCGRDPHFPDLAALERYLRQIHVGFGPIDDHGWRAMALHGHRTLPDGQIGLGYDPRIGEAFKGPLRDIDLWPLWDRVACPTLIVRGALSTLLPAETAEDMTRRGPRATLVTVADAGHAPALMRATEIEAIGAFLDS